MIEALDQLTLRQPWWLLLLLIPLAVMIVCHLRPRNSNHQRRLAQFIAPPLWNWLLTHPHRPHRHAVSWLQWLAWSTIAIAASSPHFSDSSDIQIARSIDIAVIVDISPSMIADDITPTRLGRAKLELRDFSARLKADRTALIAYSANAYKVLPLTADRDTLHHFSDALEPSLTRKRGSNLTQALELAIQQLGQSDKDGRAIVLLTDGESHNPQASLRVAQRLHNRAIPLLIVGIGTANGAMLPNERGKRLHHNGEPVISRLDSNTLQQLATTSGGVYTTVSDDDSDWDAIFRELGQLQPLNHYRVPYQPQQFQLFPWLMGAAILLFIISGLRQQRGNIWLLPLTLMVFIPGTPAQATSLLDHWQEQQAFSALKERRNAEAAYRYSEIASYNGQLGYGVAAYRQQEWQLAADAFTRALQFAENDQQRARAHYNLGNALSRLRQLDAAAEAYETALHFQRNFSRAALNLSLVNQARNRQGGVQKNEKQTPPQSVMNATQNSDAQQHSAQLNQADPQGAQHQPLDHTQAGKQLQQQTAQQDETARSQPSGKRGDNPSINWDNALQQAQAINKQLGHQFMRRRFMAQEEELTLKAEEKPW